jgi:hypothetical protein
MNAWRQWQTFLAAPVDAAALGIFRIVFGAMVAIDGCRFLAHGWVDEYFIAPRYHFTYLYLDFIRPWPGRGMVVHFAVLIAAAALVSAGLWTRAASVVLFFAYAYVLFLEQSIFMNHYYLIMLLAFLLASMPVERAFALDRWRRPDLPAVVPRWCVLLLRFQLFVVYFYGAIAKLNADWLRGEPMYSAIVHHAPDVPDIAHLLPPRFLAYFIAHAGIAIDAVVPICLCLRRARWLGFGVAVAFHVLNALFLRIGIFSYLMIGAITIFFDPDWPRRFARASRRTPHPAFPAAPPRPTWPGLIALHLWVLAQLLIPLRHYVYPGPVSWTEEGHRFAWHMKLRQKRSEIAITATDPATGRTWTIDPAADLRPRQLRKLHTFPDILLQYVHFKRDELRAQGIDPVITVDWRCSLNYRPYQRLVDPTANLAAVERSLRPARWILPLDVEQF